MPPFNVISIRSAPEIVLSSEKNYKKAKMKKGLRWITKYRERTRSLFNGNHFSSILDQCDTQYTHYVFFFSANNYLLLDPAISFAELPYLEDHIGGPTVH